jgi:pimeloyl-ACP methyl ester carboxylesterase
MQDAALQIGRREPPDPTIVPAKNGRVRRSPPVARTNAQREAYYRTPPMVAMARFVLVPGAWLGAWAWKTVTPRLEKDGHSAYPVTLTGMGERGHLATKDVGMETAIQDVLNVIQYNELDDVVLVGHSFAGKVAAAVADRAHEKVRKVVYLDAFRPERVREPQGGFDATREFGLPPPGVNGIPLTKETVERIGKDVTGANLRRMLSLATPWPVRLASDPITLSKNYDGVKEAYIFCSLSGDPVEEIVAGKWGKLYGPHTIIEAGHWPMITKPEELARDLAALAK